MTTQPTLWEDHSAQKIELKDGALLFVPNFLSKENALRLFHVFRKDTPWKQEQIQMYGKALPVPRLTCWYGDRKSRYQYSGLKQVPLAWTKELLEVKNAVEQIAPYRFNSALFNLYRNGNDSVAWHADDEPELGVNPAVASVNFGETRTFRLKHKTLKAEKFEIALPSGSLLLMHGALQHHWLHQVPKSARSLGERINLTFRKVS